GGVNRDGTPTNAQVFTATGLDLAYAGGQATFDLFLDAGTAVGNGVQVRISYDLTGNGGWERVETYRYFATDPVPGYEHYTQQSGLHSATGALGNLANGTVRVEVWSAIGNNPSTLGIGDRSVVTLPYA
ncbi:glycosyl hydrolase, partial [Micromonospora sp. URMC 106]